MNSPVNSSWPRLALFCLCALLAFSVACNRGPAQPGATTGQPAAKRYSLKGRVISVDKNAATANIDNEPIAGFMDAMIMPYTIKPPSTLDQLQPGDSITAVVVVEPDRYWLENVKVTGHSKPPAGTPTATVRIPTPGDPVPDFKLINRISRASQGHSSSDAAAECPIPGSSHRS
jgi:protein SCO1/2